MISITPFLLYVVLIWGTVLWVWVINGLFVLECQSKDYHSQHEIGNQDEIAILITKKPIDYQAIHKQLNETKDNSFTDRFFKIIRHLIQP